MSRYNRKTRSTALQTVCCDCPCTTPSERSCGISYCNRRFIPKHSGNRIHAAATERHRCAAGRPQCVQYADGTLSYDAWHVAIVLSPFVLLPAVAWIAAYRARAILLATLPAALTGYFLYAWWAVATSGPFSVTTPWAPSLGLSLSFHFD